MAGVDIPDQLTRIKASMKDHGMGKKKRKIMNVEKRASAFP